MSSVSTVRSRPGGRSRRVRRAVLDAVVELLEEGGARAVTIAEVAKRSGVNASSIYRRWHGVDASRCPRLMSWSRAAVKSRGRVARRVP